MATVVESKASLTTPAYAAQSATSPLAPFTIERRKPQSHDVLIDILYCGVCHSDIHMARNDFGFSIFPLVPGHEMAGDVLAVGDAVTRIKVGDQVASTNRETCGQCDLCRSGQEGICPKQRFFGHNGPGAYGEFALVRENALSVVPRAIPPEAACMLSCAIGTELHAIRDVGRVRAGETVLVTGAGGGLGIHGVQVAKLAGASVVGLTSTPGKAAAMAGTLLNIKPILAIERGEVVPLKRVRGAHKAFLEFIDAFEDGSVDRATLRAGIAHADAPERLEAIRELVRRTRPQARIEVETTLGAVVGTHDVGRLDGDRVGDDGEDVGDGEPAGLEVEEHPVRVRVGAGRERVVAVGDEYF